MHRGVLSALARVALMTAFQYRSNALIELVVGAGSAATGVLPLVFVYDHASTVGGWTFPEALLVTAFFFLLSSAIGVIVEPNLSAVVEGVRNGQLDYLILKPVDAQLLASCQRLSPARLWEGVAALVVGGWALAQLPTPSLAQFAVALGLMGTGLAAMYSLWVAVICLSFWFVRVDNLRYLLGALTDAGRWPVSIYRGWARVALTVVVPVALTTSFPAMALLGRMNGALVGQAAAVAVAALVLSRMAWKTALRSYTSASS